MQTLKGRTAVISGGSLGLKYEMVKQLLRDGVNVALLGHRAGPTNAAVEEARGIGGGIIGFECDVGDPARVGVCLRETAERFGGVDILMAMHGVPPLPEKSDIEAPEPGFWEENISGHLSGTYTLLHAALPYLKRSRAPRVVFEVSPAAFDGRGDVLPYSCAKAGLVALAKGSARRLAGYGITVNCVSIGGVPRHGAGPEDIAALEKSIPLGRCCTGADIAFAVETLICEEAGFITGEVLNLSGGLWV